MTLSRDHAVRLLLLFSIAAPLCAAQQPFPGESAAQPKNSQPPQTNPQTAPQTPRFTPQDFPPDPNANMPTFHVSTSVVIVPTLVEKSSGEVLYGLKPTDFSVFDNGVEQKVHVDDDLDTQPVSLVVCIERGRDAPLEFDKIGKLGPLLDLFTRDGRGDIALVAFDSRATWVEPFSQDTDNINRDLKQMPAGDGGAAILDAVGYSVNLLEQQPPDHRRVARPRQPALQHPAARRAHRHQQHACPQPRLLARQSRNHRLGQGQHRWRHRAQHPRAAHHDHERHAPQHAKDPCGS